MFSSFLRKTPQISIFHNSSSQQSTKALALLRSALSSPYPPGKSENARPLEFDLEVIESTPPTVDQIRTIQSYLPPNSTFISYAHPTASASSTGEQPKDASGIVEMVRNNPNTLKWPIVVDWHAGRAAVGDVDGVKAILEEIRKKRDGEGGEEKVDQPKGWFT